MGQARPGRSSNKRAMEQGQMTTIDSKKRDRKGSQLAIEMEPALMERLRAYAAADGRSISTLVRQWIELGLNSKTDLSEAQIPRAEFIDLVDIVTLMQDEVAKLAQWRKSQDNCHHAQNTEVDEQNCKISYSISELEIILNRRRASIYRYLNTSKTVLNPSFDPSKLNYEYRSDTKDAIRVSLQEVNRWKQFQPEIPQEHLAILPMPELSSDFRYSPSVWRASSDKSISATDHIISTTNTLIRMGILSNGDKMPSTRDLAQYVGCHRNTANKAYSIMAKNEIITGKPGSGYYVLQASKNVSICAI